ncbi:MAG: 50S ribosomal protein L24 [Alphaproteobacteria bacterium]
MAAKYKKGDTVIVLTGRDKGKKGEIMRVLPEKSRAYVQGVNVVKRHTKPTQTAAGGIVEKEASIHMSNLAHIDPKTDEPTRIGFKFMEDKTKVRYAKRSGEIIDR